MAITLLRITDFRNLMSVELSPLEQGLNILHGDNGSGKTSLLEAIYYLGLGRSFRTASASRLIREETGKFSIYSQQVSHGKASIPLGIERHTNGHTRLRIAEKEADSILDFAACLPIRLINSQSHHLFESGPSFRRKYLDWGLFYQSKSFLACWRQFERALKQRNAALREKRHKNEVQAWSLELANYGDELNALRKAYVQALTPHIQAIAAELLSIPNLNIVYQPGWDENQAYADVLTQFHPDEYRFGRTKSGPHRADLAITINQIPVKHFLSRGQQKLLICAMLIAQGMLLTSDANTGLIYLIDDLPSELDLQSRNKLISLLSKQKTQVFITAIERETISDLITQSEMPVKMFHVKHGHVFDG